MRRIVYSVLFVTLALALASCMQPSLGNSSSPSSPIGNGFNSPAGGGFASGPNPRSYVRPAPLQDATVDTAQSKDLTDYLRNHRLPLVGAQVLSNPSGQRQVILFGYVATDYGSRDAIAKAQRYMNDSSVTVDNRIKVEPDLASSASAEPSSESASGSTSSSSTYNEPGVGTEQQYERSAQNPYGGYQAYQSQSSGGLMSLLPMLGFFGGSFGGGSGGFMGGNVGGFGTGFGNYGGYGYPTYPPSPGLGYGPPYPPYP